jgi:hypothetical protein
MRVKIIIKNNLESNNNFQFESQIEKKNNIDKRIRKK